MIAYQSRLEELKLTEKDKGQADIQDIYFDRVQVTATLYGVNITFNLSEPHPTQEDKEGSLPRTKSLLTARTGLTHAKVFAMLLKRQLKAYEKDVGEINLPDEVYESLKLDKNNW